MLHVGAILRLCAFCGNSTINMQLMCLLLPQPLYHLQRRDPLLKPFLSLWVSTLFNLSKTYLNLAPVTSSFLSSCMTTSNMHVCSDRFQFMKVVVKIAEIRGLFHRELDPMCWRWDAGGPISSQNPRG